MQLPINALGSHQHITTNLPLLPPQNRIPLPHSLQIRHQRKRVGIINHHIIHIHRQQLKPRLLQQPSNIPRISKRAHAGTNPPTPLLLRQLQASPQLIQRIPAKHGGNERRIRLQHAVHFPQRQREVVDPVHRPGRDHRVERRIREWKMLLVQHYALNVYLAVPRLVRIPEQQLRACFAGHERCDPGRCFLGDGDGGVLAGDGEGFCDVAWARAEV